jgi:hypothetical protein
MAGRSSPVVALWSPIAKLRDFVEGQEFLCIFARFDISGGLGTEYLGTFFRGQILVNLTPEISRRNPKNSTPSTPDSREYRSHIEYRRAYHRPNSSQ